MISGLLALKVHFTLCYQKSLFEIHKAQIKILNTLTKSWGKRDECHDEPEGKNRGDYA